MKRDPVPFGVLLDADMWTAMLFEESFTQQATMFQPVGGMDRIAAAFAKKLGPVVRLASEVTAIRRTNSGVSISFIDKRTGRPNAIDAAYCIVTIPLKVLDGIECDFSPAYRAAIRDVDYGNAIKIAWQSRRFWETDEQIYGGISWVKGPTTLVWYPSDRFFSPKGILLGAYANRGRCGRTGEKAVARAVRHVARGDRRIASRPEPGAREADGDCLVARCLTASASPRATVRAKTASTFCSITPDGPFYFAGEHLSQIGAVAGGCDCCPPAGRST